MSEVAVIDKPEVTKSSIKDGKVDGPATSITIPVGPSLVTVGNIAVTSTALATSSGIAGPIIGAVALAGGVALWRHHKGKRPGTKSFGVKRSRSVSSRMGRSASPGVRSRSGSGLGGKLGRAGKKFGGSLANSSMGRAARRAGKALSPVGRAMRSAARGLDKGFRGVGGGLSGASRFAGRAGSGFGKVARKLTRSGRSTRTGYIDPSRDRRYDRKVGPKVNEPPKVNKDPQKPSPKPSPDRRKPVTSGNGPTGNRGPAFVGSPLADLMKTFASNASSITHRGGMETFAEANDMPGIIGMFADTLRSRVEEYRKSSIHPDYVNAFGNLCSALESVAEMSRQLAPGFADMHRDLINNLVNSPSPETWDTHNNGL